MSKIPLISHIHQRLRLKHLELILLLSEHRSLRLAAERMNLTQPALSKMLHELEDLLGLKLFERLPRGVEPTGYGDAVIRYATRVFLDMDGLRSQLITMESGELGNLRIGSIMAPAAGLLTKVITLIKKRYPQIAISVQIDTSDILVHALQGDKLDVVLGRIPLGWKNDGLLFDVSLEENLSVVVGRSHPLALIGASKFLQTIPYPWVLQAYPSPMRGIIDRELSRASARLPSSIVETSSILTTASLLQQGEFVAFLPGAIAEDYAQKQLLSVLPIALSEQLPPYGIIRRESYLIPPTTQIFIDAVRENLNVGKS